MSTADGPVMDFDALRQEMAENHGRPEGPARNARAEQLLAEAEKLGIPLAVIEALGHQLQVYNYSSEKAKMFVPFARLLRMWDERPEDFDEYETHSLHWVFKWMSAGMLGQSHIPLASIEKWLGEMERRYRLAGHSERAVRSAEFSVARHIGDLPRAERAYAAWLAADRDSMSDCHACELHDQGSWQAYLRDDAQALDLWRPVLDGEYSCAHEPHAVLASSLLPLLRLGRTDEARAHHLRGLRMVRAKESMRDAFAEHVEFCALSGNEARALELLAERPAYFTDSGHPLSRMHFLAVVAQLMDRLGVLGLAEQTVPGPAGRGWTAGELGAHARVEALALAARFDERNGSAHISSRVVERMDRLPLLERLPLGVRSVRPAGTARPAPVQTPGAPSGEQASDLPALLAEARRVSDALHPDSVRAWEAVARAAQADGTSLAPGDRAEIADHEGMDPRTPPDEAAGRFRRAAELYAEAGDPGEALAARARAAYALALAGRADEGLAAVEEPCARVLALHAEGGTDARSPGSVLASRLRILMVRLRGLEPHAPRGTDADPDTGADTGTGADTDPGGDAGGSDAAALHEAHAAAGEAARRLIAFAEPHVSQRRLAARVAEGRAALGELAAHGGDAAAAAELYARAVQEFVEAQVPWFAVEFEARLAGLARQLGDAGTAERAARGALEHGAPFMPAAGQAQLHLQLAEILADTGQIRPASDHALEAAHWADEAGESSGLGAWARHLLGGFLLRLGRTVEAAEVLESALVELTVDLHGEGTVVQTRWWLGDCLSELGEHREAAEHWLRAAEIARGWPEQRDHAMLAHLAAEALGSADLPTEADQAYERAGELWRALGNPHGLVRSLRARAWLALHEERTEQAGLPAARELMSTALRTTEAALGAAATPGPATDGDGDDGNGTDRPRLVAELAHTHRQFGELIARHCPGVPGDDDGGVARAAYEEAFAHLEQAVAGFTELGPDARDDRTGAELAAGWLEADLDRGPAAAARARAVLAAYGSPTDGPATDEDGEDREHREDRATAAARRRGAEQLLGAVEGAAAE